MEVDTSNMMKRLRPRLTPAEKEEQEKKIKLEKEQQKSAFENRPFIKFNGKVKYHTDFLNCAIICDDLLETARKSETIMVVGFDMEWTFTFVSGSERTAVIQISPDLNICYILHISEFKNLPKSLTEFLAHPNVRLTGNNIKNDIRKLGRDFVGFDADKVIENCIDLGVLANTILPVTQRWSLEKLVDYVLQMKISKDSKVRRSKWHVIPLSPVQQKYAAIDAYVSLLLYLKLKKREQLQLENNEFE